MYNAKLAPFFFVINIINFLEHLKYISFNNFFDQQKLGQSESNTAKRPKPTIVPTSKKQSDSYMKFY